jgi:hypothetical protein
MSTDPYLTLVTVPASDANFTWALKKYADSDDLTNAYDYFSKHPTGNKSRLAKVKSEIRKRKKEGRF